ncbi:MAG: glutamine synthetase III [Spirochaetes bacterium]|nr:glutamine synthetase III [Spirochaetota bacterium]
MKNQISQIYGELTFNKQIMRHKLSKNVYDKLIATIDSSETLDETIAADVAHAMKEWAIENGATHFTHWFQPQRGGTAEKHDAFITYDSNGDIIERFSAEQLIQSEPDASSFPSGGMRSTFEARGYTAWDPTSPAFLIEAENSRTLVIPTVFLSWTGDVLDIKTPFLRSVKAVSDAGIRLQKLLGNRLAKRLKIFAGPEQEYFLFSKELFNSRPDLQVCSRTLFGAEPAKGQQMEDHYFGTIKGKVLKFMENLDTELYRRGIPAKTRHNEVSPNQFEIAVLYEEANLSIDHNLQLMDILTRVAEQHDMVAVLNEKPLAGVNGSGKHLNYSIGDNTGANYLEPSKSPLKNISFIMTIAAILAGVDKYGGLLRAAVADAGNDHRLGANEAPPGIMSIYLGKYLSELLDEIEGIGTITEKKMAHINLGIQNLPKIAKDITDRNRTSPIAFTGNKFEFRAVGSSHNCAEPATILNLIIAYGYDKIFDKLSTMKGDVKSNALMIVKDIITETKRIRFDGNNYSVEWHEEAAKRGLPNAKNTPEALEFYLEPHAEELFSKYGILSERELKSKVEIKLETYIKLKEIEFKTAINMANTLILPAIAKQIKILAEANNALTQAGLNGGALANDLDEFLKLYENIIANINCLKDFLAKSISEEDIHKNAHAFANEGISCYENLRTAVDRAEEIVAEEFWPLAKYADLLTKL